MAKKDNVTMIRHGRHELMMKNFLDAFPKHQDGFPQWKETQAMAPRYDWTNSRLIKPLT